MTSGRNMLTYFSRTVAAESPTVAIGGDSSPSDRSKEQQLPPSHAGENMMEALSPTVVIGGDCCSSDTAMEKQLPPSHAREAAPVCSNKRKYKSKQTTSAHEKFASHIKSATGLDLLKADDRGGRAVSQCGNCRAVGHLTFWRNVTKKWVTHAIKCPSLHKNLLPAQPAEVEAFVMHVRLGGDKHRKNVCDAYATTYWVYKHKLAFTTGDKLREV